MLFQISLLAEFIETIRQLPQQTCLTKEQLLSEQFLLKKHGELEMYYSPHNEYINSEAKIVIVGITPGWTQMKTAFVQAVRSVHEGLSFEELLKAAKIAASFSGSMRTNLISMLNDCDVAKALNIGNSELLFSDKRDLLHTTSVIKYPVFYQHKNYTGYLPKISQSSLMSHYAYNIFPKEIAQLNNDPLIIPLGKAVEKVLHTLICEKKLPENSYLFGFPHPSGANGHRKKQFEKQVHTFKCIVQKWADKGLWN